MVRLWLYFCHDLSAKQVGPGGEKYLLSGPSQSRFAKRCHGSQTCRLQKDQARYSEEGIVGENRTRHPGSPDFTFLALKIETGVWKDKDSR